MVCSYIDPGDDRGDDRTPEPPETPGKQTHAIVAYEPVTTPVRRPTKQVSRSQSPLRHDTRDPVLAFRMAGSSYDNVLQKTLIRCGLSTNRQSSATSRPSSANPPSSSNVASMIGADGDDVGNMIDDAISDQKPLPHAYRAIGNNIKKIKKVNKEKPVAAAPSVNAKGKKNEPNTAAEKTPGHNKKGKAYERKKRKSKAYHKAYTAEFDKSGDEEKAKHAAGVASRRTA